MFEGCLEKDFIKWIQGKEYGPNMILLLEIKMSSLSWKSMVKSPTLVLIVS